MPEVNTTHKPDGVLIFSGFNQRSVVALCRTLEACRVTYRIVAHSEHDTIFKTDYACRVAGVRKNPVLDIDDLCDCIVAMCGNPAQRLVIAPSSEALNRCLLQHRTRVEVAGAVLPLVPESLYEMISDKHTFLEQCRQAGIATPNILPPHLKPQFPVVAKPLRELTIDGRRLYPVLIYDDQGWSAFEANQDRDVYFLQQYIAGPSLYLLYYVHRSGKVDKASMRNLVQQPEGKSIVAAEVADLHLDPQYEVFEELLQRLSFHGLIMVELMFEDGQFFMIEANPRMWGPAQLMADAGQNLFVSFINDLFGTAHPLDIVVAPGRTQYFWWSGFWAPQLVGKAMKWHCPPDEFLGRYAEFFGAEVYCRQDSYGIFKEEARSLPVCMQTIGFSQGER